MGFEPRETTPHWEPATSAANDLAKAANAQAIEGNMPRVDTLFPSMSLSLEAEFCEQTRLLTSVAATLQAPGTLEERCTRVLALLTETSELRAWRCAGAMLVSDDGERLEWLAMTEGFPTTTCLREGGIPVGFCLCGRAVEQKRVLICQCSELDPRHEGELQDEKPHGHYVVPLVYGVEVLGVVFVYTEPDPPEESWRMHLLNSVGQLMGTAVKEARERAARERLQAELVNAQAGRAHLLTNLSHEIRTPMTAILGYAELLSEDRTPSDGRGEYLATIQRYGRWLLNRLDNVFELARVNLHTACPTHETVDTAALVEELLATHRSFAQDRGLRLTTEIGSSVPVRFVSDPRYLRMALGHLLENAIKFTEEGSVHVDVWTTDDRPESRQLCFDVVDTGIGIAEADQPRLFALFGQIDDSMTRTQTGLGVGLAVARQLARQLGGDVELVSSEPLAGSRFRLHFRTTSIASSGGKSAGIRRKRRRVCTDGEPVLRNTRLLLAGRQGGAIHDLPERLEQCGADVERAHAGRDALNLAWAAALARRAFEVVVLANDLPNAEIPMLLEDLRARGYQEPLLGILLVEDEAERAAMIAAGANEVLCAAAGPDALVADVARWALSARKTTSV